MLPVPSLDDRATPLLKSRIQVLFRHLPKALGGDGEAIHQMRVAGRRLRIGLPLLVPKPHGRRTSRTRRAIRELVRTASTGRDLDVSLELFEAWAQENELSMEARTLLRRLRSARTRSRHRLAEDLLDLDLAVLRRDLKKILSRGGVDVFTVLGRFRALRDELGHALLFKLAATGDQFDPLALHALRRGVRRLRYVAEIGSEVLGDESREAPDRLKKMQEELGGIHDTWVLSEWFGRQRAADLRRHRTSLAHDSEALAAFWVEASRAKHAMFLKEAPAHALQQTLEVMGRQTFAA